MKKSPTCNLCGKVFSRRDNLERHLSNHQGEKLFICDFCGKSFLRKSYLKLHHRIHSGERPFQCGVCGRSFTRDDHLLRHQRSHQGYKPYTCDVCGKALSRLDHLAVHRRIHTGERPFRCDLCNCEFARSDHLLKHKRLNLCDRKPDCITMETPPLSSADILIKQQYNSQDTVHVVSRDADSTSNTLTSSLAIPSINDSIVESGCLECKNQSNHSHQIHQPQQTANPTTLAITPVVTATPTAVTVVPNELAALIPNATKFYPIVTGTANNDTGTPTQIYQTSSGVTGTINPITHIFPTIQISPATTQIFPTIQMYSAAQVNLQPSNNLSIKESTFSAQVAENE